jgi:hypothetical protein
MAVSVDKAVDSRKKLDDEKKSARLRQQAMDLASLEGLIDEQLLIGEWEMRMDNNTAYARCSGQALELLIKKYERAGWTITLQATPGDFEWEAAGYRHLQWRTQYSQRPEEIHWVFSVKERTTSKSQKRK